MSDAEWYGSQLAFIENHTYFTAAARQMRNAGKQANAAELRARLATADTGNWT
jgi:hypothetical protein